jgi:hypothetical protein
LAHFPVAWLRAQPGNEDPQLTRHQMFLRMFDPAVRWTDVRWLVHLAAPLPVIVKGLPIIFTFF